MDDNVNYPSHYTRFGKSEVIDITEELNFNRGNAVKYLSRAGHKAGTDELEDLKKAQFYVNREVERFEEVRAAEAEAEKTAALKRRLQGREAEDLRREATIEYAREKLRDEGYAHIASKNSFGYHSIRGELAVDGRSFFDAVCGKIDFDNVRPTNSQDGRCFICYAEKGATAQKKGKQEQEEAIQAVIEDVREELKARGYSYVASKNSVGYHMVVGERVVSGKPVFKTQCGMVTLDDARPGNSKDGYCFICFPTAKEVWV